MSRVKKQETGSYTFESSYFDDNGVETDVKAPATVTVRDGAGATVYTGTPTVSSGKLSISVPVASLPKLDLYKFTYAAKTDPGSVDVSWTDTVELVGGYLFELPALRAMDRAFSDQTKYPTTLLKEVRTWVEDVIEGPRAAQVSFVPRGRRVILDGNSPDPSSTYYPLTYGNDYRDLIVPDFQVRELYSASVDNVALTQAEIDQVRISDNILQRTSTARWPVWPYGRSNIQLHYKHGMDRAPGAITRAALILAREYLVKSDLPGRATATSIGDQLFRLTIAGRDGVTGIPDVDAAIDQFGRKGYGIG